jgi:hypothetical protein
MATPPVAPNVANCSSAEFETKSHDYEHIREVGDLRFRPLVRKVHTHPSPEVHDNTIGSRTNNDHATQATQRSSTGQVPKTSKCDQRQR